VCHDVSVEPSLLPLDGEQITPSSANCRASDKVHCLMLGFSIPTHQVIVSPKLLPFFADMNLRRNVNMGIVYALLMVNLVFYTFGGLGKEATIFFYNRLADLLSLKHNITYHRTLSWMRCSLSFSLLRSAIFAIRGSRKCQPVVCLH